MRKKLISKTYLRDVEEYNLKIYINNNDYYLCVKKIINTSNPFILTNGICLIDNGYYIVELIPKNENYSIRIYYNEDKEILEYYIDISLKNGLDEETKIPYYDDLYIDITITNGEIEVLDENELVDAYNNKNISINDYELAIETKNKLLREIKEHSNKYINMDFREYLK